MLKLMGNILSTQREAFLTLMEWGHEMKQGGRGDHGSLVPKLLWSFSSLHCHPEPLLAPLCLASFFPFTALHHRSQAFLLSAPLPTEPSYLWAFNTSFKLLCIVLLSSSLLCLLSFLFSSKSYLFLKHRITKCSLFPQITLIFASACSCGALSS